MKPKKTTIEGEAQERKKAMCDLIITNAARIMIEEVDAPMGMMLDRMLTYTAAQACSVDGSQRTAAAFRELAAKIEGGLFHSITGEDKKSGKRH